MMTYQALLNYSPNPTSSLRVLCVLCVFAFSSLSLAGEVPKGGGQAEGGEDGVGFIKCVALPVRLAAVGAVPLLSQRPALF